MPRCKAPEILSREASGTCGDTLPQGVPRPKGIGTCPRNTLTGEGKREDRFGICPPIIQMNVFQQPA